jgi:hypothetical protein
MEAYIQKPNTDQARLITAQRILMGLSREDRGHQCKALREYVRWLLRKRNKLASLKEFEKDWKLIEDSLEKKVQAGELSVAQATIQRGDEIWWKVMDEIGGASFYMALRAVMKRNILAALTNQPSKTNETVDELQIEIESELTDKLRELLSSDAEHLDSIIQLGSQFVEDEAEAASENHDHYILSQRGLANAYGRDEPEYPLDLIKEPNPEYERR